MRVLLDTNVVSELVKPHPDANVVAAYQGLNGPLISAITFHELSFGIARMPDGARKQNLTWWLQLLREHYADRTIAVAYEVAETAGRIRATSVSNKRNMTTSDALIAASAILNGAVLFTRNTRDFEDSGVDCFNPWTS